MSGQNRRHSGRHVARLRGITVGRHHRLAIVDLVTMFVDAGYSAVPTYIQSGNVVFDAPSGLARHTPDLIGGALLKTTGFDVPVSTRTGRTFAPIATSSPFLHSHADLKTLHVGFLSTPPPTARVFHLAPTIRLRTSASCEAVSSISSAQTESPGPTSPPTISTAPLGPSRPSATGARP